MTSRKASTKGCSPDYFEQRLKVLKDEYSLLPHQEFLEAVSKELNITVQQAYLATDYLFRPENMN